MGDGGCDYGCGWQLGMKMKKRYKIEDFQGRCIWREKSPGLNYQNYFVKLFVIRHYTATGIWNALGAATLVLAISRENALIEVDNVKGPFRVFRAEN